MTIEPRAWQEKALLDWWNAGARGVASVVTGGGKTMFALMAFERVLDQRPAAKLIVIVPSIALMDQWVVSIVDDLGIPPDDIATFSGESRSERLRAANVFVINTARTASALYADEKEALFVVDECHRAGSPENALALETSAEFRLGLSATPERQFDDGFERFVEPVLGGVFCEYDYVEARRDGVISDFVLHNFEFELSIDDEAEYSRLTKELHRMVEGGSGLNERYEEISAERSAIGVASPRRTAATIAVSRRFDARQIVFHERIDPATRICEILDRGGDRVGLYHSGLGGSIRRRNLQLFKERQFSKLVTCRALDEGLNVPDVECAIVGASTRSTRQRIQRLGRVLRVAPGKELANVATVFATELERQFLIEEAVTLGEVAAVHWYEIDVHG